MNGRGYDYKLGRFLGVDPFIQDPGNSQAINGYSYIGNSPLSGTDPTGYCAERRFNGSFSYQGLPARVTNPGRFEHVVGLSGGCHASDTAPLIVK
jgi:hypothetical protein